MRSFIWRETTVAIKGDGCGGPNTEYALALAIELKGNKNVYGIACDTDGIDGSENNAGAIITPEFWSRAQRLGLTPNNYLENNDSFSFFEKIDRKQMRISICHPVLERKRKNFIPCRHSPIISFWISS